MNAKKDNKNVKVFRSGEQKEISTYDLVVGDVMVVETGDILPADGVFVSGEGLTPHTFVISPWNNCQGEGVQD